MDGVKTVYPNRLSAETANSEEGARLDAVPHHGVRDRVELPHALNLDDGRASATDISAHLIEHVGQIDDLWLTRGVVDDGGALGVDRGHHEVLGGTHARECQRDRVARDTVWRGCMDVAMPHVKLDAKLLKAEDVHVDLARADVAAARHGNDGLAKAGDERPENRRRRTHLGNQLVGRLPFIDVRCVNDQSVLVEHVNGCTQALEHLAHDVDVRDVGDVLQRGDTRRHDGCRHELERRVLCALDRDLTSYCVTALNLDDVHIPPAYSKRPRFHGAAWDLVLLLLRRFFEQ